MMNVRTSAAVAALVLATAMSVAAHGGRSGGTDGKRDMQRTSLTELLGLTEDQQAQLTVLREAYSEQKQGLRDDKSAAVQAVLTAEQLATLEELRAESGRHRGSSAETLGLSEDQHEALGVIREEFHAVRTALREAYQADFEAVLTPEQIEALGENSLFGRRCRSAKADDEAGADAGTDEGTLETALELGESAPTAVAETTWGALKSGLR